MEADMDIIDLLRVIPFLPDAKERVCNEIVRMKQDMERLLSNWDLNQVRSMFIGPIRHRCQTEQLRGETVTEQCRSALRIGGLTFLTDAIHLCNFDMAERLRQTKLRVFTQLISRDAFFRPQNQPAAEQMGASEQQNVALFDLLSLPPEMIGQIMQRSAYKDAQHLAASCSAANDIYRKSNSNMILPDVVMVLDFSSGELVVRWWLVKDNPDAEHDLDFHSDKILDHTKKNDKKNNQLLKNTTVLKVVTSEDFEPQHCEDVRNFMGARTFKRVVVKGVEYTLNVKMMVEMFDKDCVEIEVDRLTDEVVPFPDIKTITIHENLDRDLGERLFAAKQFINITCGLNNIDTFRKALSEWDHDEREIGHWVILKQFTIFQTPFGRRYRSEHSQHRGHLQFISELDNSVMPHGEITEYVFHATE
uniref:F-box domain-containing protein n=1 Tax=Caenorhabditis tropicalis TaxID=1561998 RepID=A0A1I7V3H9_9PELO